MAERILERAAAIKRVFANDRSRRPLPNLTWQDEAVLEAVNKALKPLSDFTDILSGENHVTVSSLLPTLQLLKDNVLKEDDDDVRMTSVIKSGVLLELDNKYDNEASLKLMRLSALLDPRYKGDHIDAVSLDSMRVRLEAQMVSFCRRQTTGQVRVRVEDVETEQPVAPIPPPPLPKINKPSLGSLLRKAKQPVTLTEEQRANAEVTAYLQEEALDGDSDPLAWWKANENRFPLMAKIASKYLCICATSSPSERVFSTAGNVFTPLRSLLKPEKVNMLVFLSRNL